METDLSEAKLSEFLPDDAAFLKGAIICITYMDNNGDFGTVHRVSGLNHWEAVGISTELNDGLREIGLAMAVPDETEDDE